MVQSLCSKFESRVKVSDDADESAKGVATKSTELLQPARARRRDARDVKLAPVLLTSEVVKETDVTANARSNNLNKFLRSYASNLDHAISAERRVVMTTDVISAERSRVMSTGAEDDVEQPLLDQTDEIAAPPSDALVDSDESDMALDLDLQTLRLEVECSNQCDSPPTAGSEEEVTVLVDATDCGPVVDESLGESDEGNNVDTTTKLSKAFTITDWKISDITKLSDCNPELCLDPPAKAALDLFKQQVPSNRRARTIATLNF
ncbi:Hypothetical protein PHPALM_9928 [Phytophthora palmivora]|uniref:Uncharacterized protein n=1 Tax=Phytophthora palmivora TaxID=4796 RepID=A0A2P4Y5Z7_9STRA|nr:Hypothetical protein PHPALM_9928 [Phytophthora palmivora]